MRKKCPLAAAIPVLALAVIWFAVASGPAEPRGGYVGSEACKACHEDTFKNFMVSVHAEAKNPEGKVVGCEACHGPGQDHAEAGGGKGTIFAFKATDSAEEKANRCLACHAERKSAFHYKSSNHMNANVACSDCHRPHAAVGKDRLLKTETPYACIVCHQEMLSQTVLPDHHRMWEGMVKCWDCHKQHGRSDRMQLGGFKNEMCFKCHTNKQGPFLYEHGSVRVEGCTICHDPHGSVNRHMLRFQKVADLCFSCHAEVPSFHTRFNSTTQCTNCHNSIHGSNLDPFFLK
jgi:DmsE family decaheme c-type cytochrome